MAACLVYAFEVDIQVRRILIICNTHFQVIIAIQLKLTLFRNDEVDIHISDHSLNAKEVAVRLGETGLFNDVCYRKTKEEIASRKLKKACQFVSACKCDRCYPEYPDYDEIIFYNLNIPVYHIADSAANGSRETIFSGMEEGILSYGRMAYGKSPMILDFVRSVTGRVPIKKRIDKYYCFFPELFQHQCKEMSPVQIPSVHTTLSELQILLCKVFNFKPEPIGQKFVFFASSSDIDGHSFGETELVLKIAKIVGNENLLVKMHPRDDRSVYKNAGLTVMERSDAPWEVVQICGAADEAICMTAISGAFINSSALLGSDTGGLFWLTDQLESNERLRVRTNFIKATIDYLHEAGFCENVQVAAAKDAARTIGAYHECRS